MRSDPMGDTHNNGHFNKIVVLFNAPHEEWVLLYLRKDTCMQKPSPLRDPLASLPSDRQRLAASNYILRRSIPLRYLGAIPRRALYWISRVSSVPVLGSRAKLGPGEKSADGMARGDWAAMILEPQGELKCCQAASSQTYLSITRDFLLH